MTIDRSADPVTAVDTTEVLFAGFGSAVDDDTDAVFDNVPACAGAVTLTVITGAVVDAASTGRVQVTDTFAVLEQVHPAPEDDTNVTPAGSVSVTKTAAASDGPALATVSV